MTLASFQQVLHDLEALQQQYEHYQERLQALEEENAALVKQVAASRPPLAHLT